MRVVSLVRTCLASPSQWEGELEDGRAVYIRYRGGHFSVRLGWSIDEAIVNHQSFYQAELGEWLDGWMSNDDLREELAGVLDLPRVIGGEEL